MKDFDFTNEIHPTPSHFFIRLLYKKKMIHKVFSQNTDDLFIKCGLTEEEVIHAHGHNGSAICPVCGARDSYADMMAAFRVGEVRYCQRCK